MWRWSTSTQGRPGCSLAMHGWGVHQQACQPQLQRHQHRSSLSRASCCCQHQAWMASSSNYRKSKRRSRRSSTKWQSTPQHSPLHRVRPLLPFQPTISAGVHKPLYLEELWPLLYQTQHAVDLQAGAMLPMGPAPSAVATVVTALADQHHQQAMCTLGRISLQLVGGRQLSRLPMLWRSL